MLKKQCKRSFNSSHAIGFLDARAQLMKGCIIVVTFNHVFFVAIRPIYFSHKLLHFLWKIWVYMFC